MKKIIALIFIFSIFISSVSVSATAKVTSVTVEPSGDKSGVTDFNALRDALRDYDTVNLKSGATYIIGGVSNGVTKGALDIDSNTTINAYGATIKQINAGKGIFKTDNDATAGGYNAMVNVKINGGTYYGNNKKGATISLMKFFHGSNISVRDAVLKNVYSGHLLEFAGCKDVVVENCYFGGKCNGSNTRNEAVELDNCSVGCLGLPPESPFDNTACQNVTFRNNTVVWPRTFGSHYTYGEGKGKFNRNIYVYDNTLTATMDTGLLVFNWYNSVISGNKISGTTAGIDIVTCFTNSTVDFEGGEAALKKNNTKPYNITVKNNTITTKKGYALWIRGVAKRPIFGVTATKNVLKSGQTKTADRRSVIRVQYGTKKSGKAVTIKGNTVKKAKNEFYAYCSNSKYVNVTKNKFFYTKKAKKSVYLISCKKCKTSGNKVKKG